MRLFSTTPRSSPELVRHSQVPASNFSQQQQQQSEESKDQGIVKGVSTLGRKFSRRFEKFGDSETARRLRMASPSRKCQWALQESNGKPKEESNQQPKRRISRVDSFRNFFSLVTTSSVSGTAMRTPRAVKRRSRKQSKNASLVDVGTCTNEYTSLPLNARFGSELALSECQSEADLRYYCTTDDEDERSVVSDGFGRLGGQQQAKVVHAHSRSAGNLVGSAARLGILPENRTINTFQVQCKHISINWFKEIRN